MKNKRNLKNEEIVKLIHSGASLAEIATLYNITGERVRQIFNEKGANYTEILKIRRIGKQKHYLKQIGVLVSQLNRIPIMEEITAKYGPIPEKLSYIQYFKTKGFKKLNTRGKYNSEKLLNELKRLSKKLGRTPGIKDLLKYSRFSHTLYYTYFGSMINAQKMAGLKPNPQGYQGK